MAVGRVGNGAGAKLAGVPKYVSGTQNCAWLRAPWGGDEETLHHEPHGGVQDERYKRAISRLLKNEVLYLNFNPAENCLNIKIRGGMIQDFGDCLVAESGTDREITVLGKLIGFKKWQSVELTGTSRFREQAMLESLHLGVQVLGCAMPEHLKTKLMGMRQAAPATVSHLSRKKPATTPAALAAAPDEEAEQQIQGSVDQYVLDMLSE
jgi:hypothetical protein